MSDEETRVARSRLTILIATCSVDMIGFAMVLPLLPFYALELKASPVIIGLIISSFSVAQLLSSPIWGRVSDRYGRRPALLIGLSAYAASQIDPAEEDDRYHSDQGYRAPSYVSSSTNGRNGTGAWRPQPATTPARWNPGGLNRY